MSIDKYKTVPLIKEDGRLNNKANIDKIFSTPGSTAPNMQLGAKEHTDLFTRHRGSLGIGTDNISNYMESRARFQSNFEQIGNTSSRVVSELVGGLVESSGAVLNAVERYNGWILGALFGADNIAPQGSPISRALMDIGRGTIDLTNEIAPIYMTNKAMNGSIWEKMGERSFWYTSVPAIVSSALSIALPARAASIGLNKALHGLFNTMKRSQKASELMKLTNPIRAQRISRGIDYASDVVGSAVVSRTIDSTREAIGLYEEEYDWFMNNADNYTKLDKDGKPYLLKKDGTKFYLESKDKAANAEKYANEAADLAFRLSLMNIGYDVLEWAGIMKIGRGVSRAYRVNINKLMGKKDTFDIFRSLDAMPNMKTVSTASMIGAGAISSLMEGLDEMSMAAFGDEAVNRIRKDYGLLSDLDYSASFGQRLKKYYADPNNLGEGIAGLLGGAIMTPTMAKLEKYINKEGITREKMFVEAIEASVSNMRNTIEEVAKALSEGDIIRAKELQTDAILNQLASGSIDGSTEYYLEMLENLNKHLKDIKRIKDRQDRNQSISSDEQMLLDKAGELVNHTDFIDHMINQIKELKPYFNLNYKKYENIKDPKEARIAMEIDRRKSYLKAKKRLYDLEIENIKNINSEDDINNSQQNAFSERIQELEDKLNSLYTDAEQNIDEAKKGQVDEYIENSNKINNGKHNKSLLEERIKQINEQIEELQKENDEINTKIKELTLDTKNKKGKKKKNKNRNEIDIKKLQVSKNELAIINAKRNISSLEKTIEQIDKITENIKSKSDSLNLSSYDKKTIDEYIEEKDKAIKPNEAEEIYEARKTLIDIELDNLNTDEARQSISDEIDYFDTMRKLKLDKVASEKLDSYRTVEELDKHKDEFTTEEEIKLFNAKRKILEDQKKAEEARVQKLMEERTKAKQEKQEKEKIKTESTKSKTNTKVIELSPSESPLTRQTLTDEQFNLFKEYSSGDKDIDAFAKDKNLKKEDVDALMNFEKYLNTSLGKSGIVSDNTTKGIVSYIISSLNLPREIINEDDLKTNISKYVDTIDKSCKDKDESIEFTIGSEKFILGVNNTNLDNIKSALENKARSIKNRLIEIEKVINSYKNNTNKKDLYVRLQGIEIKVTLDIDGKHVIFPDPLQLDKTNIYTFVAGDNIDNDFAIYVKNKSENTSRDQSLTPTGSSEVPTNSTNQTNSNAGIKNKDNGTIEPQSYKNEDEEVPITDINSLFEELSKTLNSNTNKKLLYEGLKEAYESNDKTIVLTLFLLNKFSNNKNLISVYKDFNDSIIALFTLKYDNNVDDLKDIPDKTKVTNDLLETEIIVNIINELNKILNINTILNSEGNINSIDINLRDQSLSASDSFNYMNLKRNLENLKKLIKDNSKTKELESFINKLEAIDNYIKQDDSIRKASIVLYDLDSLNLEVAENYINDFLAAKLSNIQNDILDKFATNLNALTSIIGLLSERQGYISDSFNIYDIAKAVRVLRGKDYARAGDAGNATLISEIISMVNTAKYVKAELIKELNILKNQWEQTHDNKIREKYINYKFLNDKLNIDPNFKGLSTEAEVISLLEKEPIVIIGTIHDGVSIDLYTKETNTTILENKQLDDLGIYEALNTLNIGKTVNLKKKEDDNRTVYESDYDIYVKTIHGEIKIGELPRMRRTLNGVKYIIRKKNNMYYTRQFSINDDDINILTEKANILFQFMYNYDLAYSNRNNINNKNRELALTNLEKMKAIFESSSYASMISAFKHIIYGNLDTRELSEYNDIRNVIEGNPLKLEYKVINNENADNIDIDSMPLYFNQMWQICNDLFGNLVLSANMEKVRVSSETLKSNFKRAINTHELAFRNNEAIRKDIDNYGTTEFEISYISAGQVIINDKARKEEFETLEGLPLFHSRSNLSKVAVSIMNFGMTEKRPLLIRVDDKGVPHDVKTGNEISLEKFKTSKAGDVLIGKNNQMFIAVPQTGDTYTMFPVKPNTILGSITESKGRPKHFEERSDDDRLKLLDAYKDYISDRFIRILNLTKEDSGNIQTIVDDLQDIIICNEHADPVSDEIYFQSKINDIGKNPDIPLNPSILFKTIRGGNTEPVYHKFIQTEITVDGKSRKVIAYTANNNRVAASNYYGSTTGKTKYKLFYLDSEEDINELRNTIRSLVPYLVRQFGIKNNKADTRSNKSINITAKYTDPVVKAINEYNKSRGKDPLNETEDYDTLYDYFMETNAVYTDMGAIFNERGRAVSNVVVEGDRSLKFSITNKSFYLTEPGVVQQSFYDPVQLLKMTQKEGREADYSSINDLHRLIVENLNINPKFILHRTPNERIYEEGNIRFVHYKDDSKPQGYFRNSLAIDIYYNPKFMNTPVNARYIERTLVHEMIHSVIFRSLNTNSSDLNTERVEQKRKLILYNNELMMDFYKTFSEVVEQYRNPENFEKLTEGLSSENKARLKEYLKINGLADGLINAFNNEINIVNTGIEKLMEAEQKGQPIVLSSNYALQEAIAFAYSNINVYHLFNLLKTNPNENEDKLKGTEKNNLWSKIKDIIVKMFSKVIKMFNPEVNEDSLLERLENIVNHIHNNINNNIDFDTALKTYGNIETTGRGIDEDTRGASETKVEDNVNNETKEDNNDNKSIDEEENIDEDDDDFGDFFIKTNKDDNEDLNHLGRKSLNLYYNLDNSSEMLILDDENKIIC